MFKLVVLSCLVAAAAASGLLAGYAAPLAYGTPLLTPYNYNYRGPLSLAPGQPANILAADGRPLDTLDVNLDRSAHYTAKALEGSGFHLLKKRSAVLAAPAPLISRVAYGAPLLAHSAPLAYSAHSAPLAYSAHSTPLAYSAHITPYASLAYHGYHAAPYAHALY